MGAPVHRRRYGVIATSLSDGRVLIVGGIACQVITLPNSSPPTLPRCGQSQQDAEAFDPSTGTFAAVGRIAGDRTFQSAVRLVDGRVLVVGASGLPSDGAALWDPTTGAFTPAGQNIDARLGGQTATLLADGEVLVTGGATGSLQDDVATQMHFAPLATAELWDPVTMTFGKTGAMAQPRYLHTATLLPDGRVLIAGGDGVRPADFNDHGLRSMEIWDPATGAFSPLADLRIGRANHTATLLQDGSVLIVGGDVRDDHGSIAEVTASAELVVPGG